MTGDTVSTADRVTEMQVAIRELTAVVTFAQALDIVRRWGNRRFRVPMKVAETDPLALTLGLECAQKLVQAYGGQCLELPAERHALRQMRDNAIWKACVEDKRSPADVALEFGLTRQNISVKITKMQALRQAADKEGVTC